MPYSLPAGSTSPSLPVHSLGRARHRRSYSDAPSGPSAPGAFAPLGVPSRRHRSPGAGTYSHTPHGGPKFHFKNDQETSSQSDSDSDSDTGSHPYPPVLKLKPRLSPTFSPASLSTAGLGNVPFPSRSSPTKTHSPQFLAPNVASASPESGSGSNSPRPDFPRTNSTPILLSNGKPLKSSLKSSNSSPAISPTHSPTHLRAASVPATPYTCSPSASTPTTPVTPHKNVHFPREEEGGQLASVRIYSRSARPASISLPLSQSLEDTETETETDRDNSYFRAPSAMGTSTFASAGSSSMPFPKLNKLPARSRSQTLPSGAPTAAPTLTPTPVVKEKQTRKVWALDHTKCSAVPSHSPSVYGNVHLESLTLTSSASASGSDQITLRGTLLVRNLAYEKTVAMRFTLDDWETTSEVVAHHVASLPSLPHNFFRPGSGLKSVNADGPSPASSDEESKASTSTSPPTWDRFEFTVKLDDYAHSLTSRTLWFVARYAVPYVHTRAHSLDDLASFAAVVNSGTPFVNRRASGGEWENGMTKMGVVTGQGGEWWDNNGGGNYRVAFRMEDADVEAKPTLTLNTAVDTPTPTREQINGSAAKKAADDDDCDEEDRRKAPKNGLGLKGMEARERKGGGSYPFPITASTIGTPSITFSPASPPENSYFPPQPPAAPSLSRPTAKQQAQLAQQTAAARAQTTLVHLKGLRLQNYAAPSTSRITPPAVMQRSRSVSPTSATPVPAGGGERERSVSTSSIPPSASGPKEITPSMMNMNIAATKPGPEVGGGMLSSSPPYSSFAGFGRKTALSAASASTQGDDGNKSDSSSTSSNSTSETPPLLSPLMSPVVEFSSFAFDGSPSAPNHGSGWGSFGSILGGFPATIVSDPQHEMGMGMGVGFGEVHRVQPHEKKREVEPKHEQQHHGGGGFSLYWPWSTAYKEEKEREEDEREEYADDVKSPSALSTASATPTATPASPATTTRVQQPSPQPVALRRMDNAENKPRRPHSPLSNPSLNRAAIQHRDIKRPTGRLSRESSLDSIPELARAASASAVPGHITTKPYVRSPLQSPSNSPAHSPRTSPHGSREGSPLPPPLSMDPPMSPGTFATDSAYQAFVKKWCFAQGPAGVVV